MKKNKKYILIALVIILLSIATYLIISSISKNTKDDINSVQIVSTTSDLGQLNIEDNIKEDLEKNKYKLENAKFYINPYGKSPLSGLLVFYSENSSQVSVTIKGKHNDDITYTSSNNKYHYVPIYYLYTNYNNTVTISLDDGESKTFSIVTDNIEAIPNTEVYTNAIDDNDLYFITSPITMSSIAVDKYGEIRWYAQSLYHTIEPLENGHLLIGTSDFAQYGLYKMIIEIDYLGRVYKTYDIESGYSNSFKLKKDGNIITTSKKDNRNTSSDYIIEIDGKTGKIVKSWDIYEMFSKIDPDFVKDLDEEYFFNSGIEYYNETDTLLLTYWNGEFVINLKYSTGEIRWIFSNPDNFGSKFSSYLLKGDITYPKSMHSASLNGNILKVFDNGFSTNNLNLNSGDLVGSYSSANTYELSGKTIRLVSSIDEGKKLFSYALADYKAISESDEIVLFGRELENFDYSQNSNISLHSDLSSRLLERINGTNVLDMKISWATYSVIKINPNNNITFDFSTSVYKTTIPIASYTEINEEMRDLIKNSTNNLSYNIGYNNSIIDSNSIYFTGDEVKIILIDEKNNGYVYDFKKAGEKSNNKIAIDLNKGKYTVYVYENGTMYKTDKFIEIE